MASIIVNPLFLNGHHYTTIRSKISPVLMKCYLRKPRFQQQQHRTLIKGPETVPTPVCREVMFPASGRSARVTTDIRDALSCINSGANIFVHGVAATPTPLLQGLVEHVKANNLNKITLHHIHLEGPAPWIESDVRDQIRSNSLFTGKNLRKSVNEGITDFNSIYLSEIPLLFRRGVVPLDVALLTVSPPDSQGFCSLGTSVDISRAAVTHAKHIIALSNPCMPRTFGESLIHSSHIDVLVDTGKNGLPLHQLHTKKISDIERQIGELIAQNLVDDGATLQMGIGSIPDAALNALKDHKDLGIHTEMFSDGIIPLVECSAITNAKKFHHPGKLVVSFVLGSPRLYEFLNDNPFVYFGDVQWVNDPFVIRENPKVTAINSAVEVDITGQVVADSVGKRFLSGFGGQVDFIRGASWSSDGLGRPIIALASTDPKTGDSKIVPFIKEGSGVVTNRGIVRYVVTEFGIAQLWGKNMRQRAYEMIRIANPVHREQLEKAAFERFKVMPSAD